MAKTTVHKVLFLVSMDCQRSKKLDGSQFWALECLLTASGWLESIWAIMAPPCSITYIPDLALDRVKGKRSYTSSGSKPLGFPEIQNEGKDTLKWIE